MGRNGWPRAWSSVSAEQYASRLCPWRGSSPIQLGHALVPAATGHGQPSERASARNGRLATVRSDWTGTTAIRPQHYGQQRTGTNYFSSFFFGKQFILQMLADQLKYASEKGYLDISYLNLSHPLPAPVCALINTLLSKIPLLESAQAELKQLVCPSFTE